MESIGIRELKEILSSYLKKVKTGERIIVTERKKEIAIILPLKNKPLENKLHQMISNGMASWAGGKPGGIPKRIISKGKKVSSAVIEDRR